MFFEKKSSFAPYFFTFVGGVVAGGVVALLFTPIPGKKMQKKVVEKVDDLQDAVKRFATA